jgi:cellobiose-specific phosphotransferase system component IIC
MYIVKTKIITNKIMNALPKSVYDVVAHTIYRLVPTATVIIVILLLLLLLLLLYGPIPGVHKSLASGCRDVKTSYVGAQDFWVLSMELASSHPSGA